MELDIIEEKHNPFFKRKELVIILKHPNEPTPSRVELVKKLVEKYNVDESQVQIDHIFTKKGVSESLTKVKILEEKPKEKEKEKQKVEKSEKETEEQKEEKVEKQENLESERKSEKSEAQTS
jgi:ribosomal protein S24E